MPLRNTTGFTDETANYIAMKIKLNIEEQIKWYDTFLYYSDLFPNESIEYVIKRTNERVYGDENKQ